MEVSYSVSNRTGKGMHKAHMLQVFVKEEKQRKMGRRLLGFGPRKKAMEEDEVQRKYANYTNYPVGMPTKVGHYKPMYMHQMPPLKGAALKISAGFVRAFGVPRAIMKLGGRDALCDLKELELWSERWDPRVILPSIRQPPCSLSDIKASPQCEYITAMDLHKLYLAKTITPSQIVSNIFDRVTESEYLSKVFVTINFLNVLKAAAASTERYADGRPLSIFDGIPIVVKDEVNVKNLPTTYCCRRAEADKIELRSAWAVEKLEEQGAICVGKSTMHEMGIDVLCINPITGVLLNPWDQSRLAGGSSGGSTVAVVSGLVPVAIGTDGGGNLRIPASWCGGYALKASYGRMSLEPRSSFGPDWSANVVGPVTATMQDLEMTYLVMSKPNALDPLGAAMPAASIYCQEKPLLGVYWPWFNDCSPQVLQTCKDTLDFFASVYNVAVVEIEVPYVFEGRSAAVLTLLAEIAATFRKFPDTTGLSCATQVMYGIGKVVSIEDIQASARLRNLLMCHFSHLFRMYAGISRPLVIMTPTVPITAASVYSHVENGVSDINMSVQLMEYVWLSSFIGCPSITFPVGYDNFGMPIGMQAMTEWGCENLCFKVGRWAEKYLHTKGRRMPSQWVNITESCPGKLAAAPPPPQQAVKV